MDVGCAGENSDSLRVMVLDWLSERRHMVVLQRQCEDHRTNGKNAVVYQFTLCVDPSQLMQDYAILGSLLLHHPQSAWQLFHEVCYTTVSAMQWLPSLSSTSQLLLCLRLTSLPELPGYTINHISDFPPMTEEPRFFAVRGVVCGASLPDKYTQSACFYCLSEGCRGRSSDGGRDSGGRYIRLHIAGATESAIIGGDFTCYQCGASLVEDVAYRTLADKTVIQVVPCAALQMASSALHPAQQQRHQAITVTLRDELCDGVRVGGEYGVIGIPIYEVTEVGGHSRISVSLEANNIFHVSPTLPHTLTPHTLTPAAQELYQACQYSAWVFSATLAYSFTAEVAPPGAFHRLKLALLLSLCATPTDNRLHVLAVGSDPSLLLSLLTSSASLSPRALLPSGGNDSLHGNARKDGNMIVLDGGSLALAEGGVCLAGSLSSWRKEARERLQQTLERNQITVCLPHKLGSEEAQQVSWPLRSTVWACADRQTRSREFSRADTDVVKAHTMHETSTISKALADRFGLVQWCDPPGCGGEEALSDVMTQHILRAATGIDPQPPLSHQDFSQLLAVAHALDVELSHRARRLLRSFYLGSRRARVGSRYGTDMPLSALDTMMALAIAHARLSLRTEAVEEDAVMAILLYEESMVSRFGYSVLDLVPAPHFREDNMAVNIGRGFDRQMQQLHSQIVHFCKCHAHTVPAAPSHPTMPEE